MDIDVSVDVLKNELASYDYIGVKIAMGVASPEEYATEIARTEELRRQIRELEQHTPRPHGETIYDRVDGLEQNVSDIISGETEE